MGLNPTILRQVRAFAFFFTPPPLSATAARRPYRESGLVHGRRAVVALSPISSPASRGRGTLRSRVEGAARRGVGPFHRALRGPPPPRCGGGCGTAASGRLPAVGHAVQRGAKRQILHHSRENRCGILGNYEAGRLLRRLPHRRAHRRSQIVDQRQFSRRARRAKTSSRCTRAGLARARRSCGSSRWRARAPTFRRRAQERGSGGWRRKALRRGRRGPPR